MNLPPPLTPSLSPPRGEGARRAGEGWIGGGRFMGRASVREDGTSRRFAHKGEMRPQPDRYVVRVILTVFEPRSLPVVVFTYTLKLLSSPFASSPCVVKNSRAAFLGMLPMTTSFAAS